MGGLQDPSEFGAICPTQGGSSRTLAGVHASNPSLRSSGQASQRSNQVLPLNHETTSVPRFLDPFSEPRLDTDSESPEQPSVADWRVRAPLETGVITSSSSQDSLPWLRNSNVSDSSRSTPVQSYPGVWPYVTTGEDIDDYTEPVSTQNMMRLPANIPNEFTKHEIPENERIPAKKGPRPSVFRRILFGLGLSRSTEPNKISSSSPGIGDASRRSSNADSKESLGGGSDLTLPSQLSDPEFDFKVGEPITTAPVLRNTTEMRHRHAFIIATAKALLTFGAPSHRIEDQLIECAEHLGARASFVHIPNILMVTLGHDGGKDMQTQFVKANGRIALSSMTFVHDLISSVCKDKVSCIEGTKLLEDRMKQAQERPLYPWQLRCFFNFISSSIICTTAFGGSLLDMWISGICSALILYLNLSTSTKDFTMLENVYEISAAMFVSLTARGLSTIPDNLFCYSAISSAGVVTILPGFTILLSALELTSRNILCGSVRMVYAIIYTLFLSFSLTIGSDLYLVTNKHARQEYLHPAPPPESYFHGIFKTMNGTSSGMHLNGTFGFANLTNDATSMIQKGCLRSPDWPWWRQPFPWWTLLFLVPLYSTCSSLSNLQYWRSRELYVMVLFSCTAYTANKYSNKYLPDRGDIVSAIGAVVIGSLGNIYSRLVGGVAFTSMVTGVLFLVPSGIAQAGGISQTFLTSADQYQTGFGLAIRMIEVAIGVVIGLFVSQLFLFTNEKREESQAARIRRSNKC